MGLIIGLMLIPVIIKIIQISNRVTIKKSSKIFLNILLVVISLTYIILNLVFKIEPFNFEEYYSSEYMFYSGDYIIYSGLIFMFTPFIWIIAFHFLKMIFYSIRVRKNAIIKRDEDYIYYRGDLDKICPSIIMFVSTFELDFKKCISATIMKLKHTGYIEEINKSFRCTNKDNSSLLESEKMVLNLVKNNNFDKTQYRKAVEEESLKNKYIVKNNGSILFRIIKIIIAICIPFVFFAFSVWLDQYCLDNYHVYPEDDGHAYICLKNDDEIMNLYENEIKDENDYYHSIMYDDTFSYNYSEIRADKFQYSVVRKAFFLNTITPLIIGYFTIFVLIALYIIVEQIRYFNKNYRRTIKGKNLLNKAYALKNYLKDYSLIKNRTEKELILWEYYLIYAIILDVNVKLPDKIIEKYVKDIV